MLDRASRAVTLLVTLAALAFAGTSLATMPDGVEAQIAPIDWEEGPCFVGCCPGGPPPCTFIDPVALR